MNIDEDSVARALSAVFRRLEAIIDNPETDIVLLLRAAERIVSLSRELRQVQVDTAPGAGAAAEVREPQPPVRFLPSETDTPSLSDWAFTDTDKDKETGDDCRHAAHSDEFGYERKARRPATHRHSRAGVSALALSETAPCGTDPAFALAGLADMVVHGRTRRWQDPGWR